MVFTPGSTGFANPGLFSKLIVIVSKPGQGIFGYAPSPGLGNLVFSIVSATAPPGKDGYGNTYLPGVTAYKLVAANDFRATQLVGGTINFLTATSAGGIYSVNFNIILQPDKTGLAFNANVSGNTIVIGEAATNLQVTNGGASVIGGLTADKGTITAAANMPILSIIDTLAGATGALVAYTVQATGDNFFRARVAGDTNNRIGFDWISASGTNTPRFHMGDGTASPDVNMYRALLAHAWVTSQLIYDLGGGNQETDNIPTFANSWATTAGRAGTFFRRLATWDTMEWVGAVTVPTGFATGQNMITATPAIYHPNSIQSLTAWDTSNNNTVRLAYTTTGILQFLGPVANTAVGHNLDIPAQRIRISV